MLSSWDRDKKQSEAANSKQSESWERSGEVQEAFCEKS